MVWDQKKSEFSLIHSTSEESFFRPKLSWQLPAATAISTYLGHIDSHIHYTWPYTNPQTYQKLQVGSVKMQCFSLVTCSHHKSVILCRFHHGVALSFLDQGINQHSFSEHCVSSSINRTCNWPIAILQWVEISNHIVFLFLYLFVIYFHVYRSFIRIL